MRILVIGGGSGLQPRLRQAAPEVETAVICRASVLPWVHELPENRAVVVLNDDCSTKSWLAAARQLHREWPFDTVASFAEIDQDRAALVAASLGLPFHSPETVQRVHDKAAMRTRLNEMGVESMPFRQVRSEQELADFCAEVGPPLLVKPTCGRASAGIALVRDPADIEAAFALCESASAPRLEPSSPLAERYVPGPEFSVETISHRGVHYVFAISEQFKDERSKVEVGHVTPARISEANVDRIAAHVRTCLTALEISYGLTHTEVILGPDGPVLVETHLRQAGDEIIDLVEAATGIDLTELLLQQIVGTDLAVLPEVASRAVRPHYHAAGAIRFLAPEEHGRLDGIDGLADASGLDGVDDVSQLVDDGSELTGLRSAYSRLVSVRGHAADADAAVRLVEIAAAKLSVRVTAST